jgi:hypothetical protein
MSEHKYSLILLILMVIVLIITKPTNMLWILGCYISIIVIGVVENK